MDKNWKKVERAVGDILGLPKGKQRVGARGDSSFDVIVPIMVDGRQLGVEVKYRKSLPSYIFEWMEQAQGHKATVKDWEPTDAIVVMIGYRKTKKQYLAMLPLDEYVELRRRAEDKPIPKVLAESGFTNKPLGADLENDDRQMEFDL